MEKKNTSAELLRCKTVARHKVDVNHLILLSSPICLYQLKILRIVFLLCDADNNII